MTSDEVSVCHVGRDSYKDKNGGALSQMLPFRAGLGGRTGAASRDFRGVYILDIARAIEFLIEKMDYQVLKR